MSKKIVKCPRCLKDSVYDETNEFRPFCSERCQTLDLGAWAAEKFTIPAEENVNVEVNKNQAEDEEDHH